MSIQWKCHVDSCHIGKFKFWFWNFLEFFFQIFKIHSLLNQWMCHLQIERANHIPCSCFYLVGPSKHLAKHGCSIFVFTQWINGYCRIPENSWLILGKICSSTPEAVFIGIVAYILCLSFGIWKLSLGECVVKVVKWSQKKEEKGQRGSGHFLLCKILLTTNSVYLQASVWETFFEKKDIMEI